MTPRRIGDALKYTTPLPARRADRGVLTGRGRVDIVVGASRDGVPNEGRVFARAAG